MHTHIYFDFSQFGVFNDQEEVVVMKDQQVC